jgi:hypothetical protein
MVVMTVMVRASECASVQVAGNIAAPGPLFLFITTLAARRLAVRPKFRAIGQRRAAARLAGR